MSYDIRTCCIRTSGENISGQLISTACYPQKVNKVREISQATINIYIYIGHITLSERVCISKKKTIKPHWHVKSTNQETIQGICDKK